MSDCLGRPSVRRSVGPSVGWSVPPSVRPSIGRLVRRSVRRSQSAIFAGGGEIWSGKGWYMSYTLFRGFVITFFCLSVSQSVGPSIGQLVCPLVLWLVLLPVLPLDGCIVVCLSDLLNQIYVVRNVDLNGDKSLRNRFVGLKKRIHNRVTNGWMVSNALDFQKCSDWYWLSLKKCSGVPWKSPQMLFVLLYYSQIWVLFLVKRNIFYGTVTFFWVTQKIWNGVNHFF